MRDHPSDATVHHPATPSPGSGSQNTGPRTLRAFEELRRAIFTESALDSKTKQLIAVAVAHVEQCPYCIDGHLGLARRAGATPEEIAEALRVATEIHAGGTFVHLSSAPFEPLHPTSLPGAARSRTRESVT